MIKGDSCDPEPPVDTEASSAHRRLEPPESPAPWVVWGLIVQLLGLGSVAVVMWRNIRHQGISSHITAEMVKLAWHSEMHTRSGLIVLIAGSFVYAAGSVLMARPYILSPAELFIAVPIAAVVGMLVLGVLVLVVGVLFVMAEGGDLPLPLPGFGARRRRKTGQ